MKDKSNVPDTNVGDMIYRRAATTIPVMPKEHRRYQTNNLDDAYEQGWNDLQECIENLPPAQPTLMRSIGKLIGYTGEPCPNRGRLRVERYESGLEICEKCKWCEQTKSYWLDWEEG